MILDRFPRREIYLHGDLYMTRWYLGEVFGYKVCLHKFVLPDPDRFLHTHPWDKAFSFILWGSYIEKRAKAYCALEGPKVEYRHRRWFNYIPGTIVHRVYALRSKKVWTLFCMGTKIAKWGFLESHKNPEEGSRLWDWKFIPYSEREIPGSTHKDFGTCPMWTGEPL